MKEATTLEEHLAFLARYGQPRLGVYSSSGGWHCSVELFVVGEGISFEIKSDFDHPTPSSAALQCHERLLTAGADLSRRLLEPSNH